MCGVPVRDACRIGLLIVIMAGSIVPAAGQDRGEGQRGQPGSAQAHYVVSMLELSRRPQLPDREESEGGDNRSVSGALRARPLPTGAEIGVPWPPLGNPVTGATISL